MIDIDRMDQQLESALVDVPGRGPAPPAREPTPSSRRRSGAGSAPAPAAGRPPEPPRAPAVELLAAGRLEEADEAMAGATPPRDALTWATMRALLDGRREPAAAGVEELRRLAGRTDDAEALDRYWVQRFWVAFEWGSGEERHDVLDHCRTRAYRFDDPQWWGNLTLLLAALGKVDEATRAFDEAARLAPGVGCRLDVATSLVEAAALFGDAGRVAAAARSLDGSGGRLVVVGPGVICKGSIDRYRALALAAAGRWTEAGACFRQAESVHRALGAGPLLSRTLQQACGAMAAA